MAAKGKSAKDIEKAKDKEAYDDGGLAKAKAGLGGTTHIFRTVIVIEEPGLLHNPFLEATLKTLHGARSKKKEKTDPKDKTYRNEDGVICHPAWHIKSALVEAAKQFTVAGQGRKTYRDLVRATVFVSPKFIPLNDPKGKPFKEVPKINIDHGNTATGTAMVIERPEFPSGSSLEFDIYAKYDYVPGTVIRDVLITAGRLCGIGDHRPDYGRFEVTKFERV